MRNATNSSYPLIRIHLYSNGTLILSQEAIDGSTKLYSVPIEIVDDLRRHTQIVLHDAQLFSNREAKMVLAEATSYARHLYNVRLMVSCAYLIEYLA